jgi:DNA polymerase-3 subunit epsilon
VNVGSDRIIELAMVKVQPSGSKDVKTYRINPTIPIPAEATAVHGISDSDVKNEPPFTALAKDIHAFLGGCDLAVIIQTSLTYPS